MAVLLNVVRVTKLVLRWLVCADAPEFSLPYSLKVQHIEGSQGSESGERRDVPLRVLAAADNAAVRHRQLAD